MGRVAANLRAWPIGIGLGSIVPCLGTIAEYFLSSFEDQGLGQSRVKKFLSGSFGAEASIWYHFAQHWNVTSRFGSDLARCWNLAMSR